VTDRTRQALRKRSNSDEATIAGAGLALFFGSVALVWLLSLASPCLADDPRAVQARLKQAEQALRAKTKEVIQAAKGLGKNLDDGLKRIKELERHLEDLHEGRALASRAAELAENALDAAKNCRKSEFDRLSKEAREAIKKAEQAQDRAKKFLDASQKMKDYIDSLKSMGEQEYEEYKEAAQAAGLGDRFGVATDDFEFHKDALLDELRSGHRQRFKVDAYEAAAADLHRKVLKIKEALDKLLKEADEKLREAKALRDKPCPSTAAGGFKAPPTALLDPITPALPLTEKGGQPVSAEMTVVVESRPATIVCLPKGAKIAGLNGEVIAEGPAEVLVATSKTPEEVQKLATASGVTLCFVEIDFCVIKTPLTAFRGHVHTVHPAGLHNHDAPDPPWDWAVTPPEPVVSWGGE
jgi:hypothetical protein